MTSQERYEEFLKCVREAEFAWNPEPDDLDMVAAFLKAKAETKRLIRGAIKPAQDALYVPKEWEDNGDVA